MSRIVLGTIAVEQSDVVTKALEKFGAKKIAVGIDARDGVVRVRGWQSDGGVSAQDLALQMRMLGLRTIIFTDVSRDGMGHGLNIPATRELADVSGLDVIASGGVHTLDDVIAARDAGLAGAIIGRALYEGTIDLTRNVARLQVESLRLNLATIWRIMLAKRIIPCLDIKDGRVVKGREFCESARCGRPCGAGAFI